MLENVKELTIRGGYFETPVVFNFLKGKVNIVFGRNGGGKTTISRALREFATKVWKIANINILSLLIDK